MVGYGSMNNGGKSNCDYRWWWQTTIKVDIGSGGGWWVWVLVTEAVDNEGGQIVDHGSLSGWC